MDSFTLLGKNQTYLLYRFIFEPVKSNMFVLFNNQEAIVFDPNENDELLKLFSRKKVTKVSIILTHEHYDHTSGVNWLRTFYDAKLYCQKDCAKAIEIKRKNNPALIALVWANRDKLDGGNRYQTFKEHFKPYQLKANVTFEDTAEWTIAGLRILCVSTPGHCPGSSFYWLDENLVFTGDTILRDSPIILKFPESDDTIYRSRTLPYIKSLHSDTLLIPGHGDPFLLKNANYL